MIRERAEHSTFDMLSAQREVERQKAMHLRALALDMIRYNHHHLGQWLGYPPCCVSEMRWRHSLGWPRFGCEPIPEEFQRTGFVPCVRCIQTRPPHVILDYIRENRVCPDPFPEWDSMTLDNAIKFNFWCDFGRSRPRPI